MNLPGVNYPGLNHGCNSRHRVDKEGGIICQGVSGAEAAQQFRHFSHSVQMIETMQGGDMKLLVVPPSLGYGSKGISLPQVGAGGGGMCWLFGPLYVNSLTFHTFCVCASFGLDLRGQYLLTPNCTTKWSSFGGCLKRRQMWCNDASGFLPVMGDSRGVMILTLWVSQFLTSL